MDYIDEIYNFKGLWGVPSQCGLKVVKKEDKSIFIATELYDRNPGTTITNFCAQLATQLCFEYKVEPEKFIFIEHAPDVKSKLEIYSETFDLINFHWDGEKFTDPKWERLKKENVDKMIEQ